MRINRFYVSILMVAVLSLEGLGQEVPKIELPKPAVLTPPSLATFQQVLPSASITVQSTASSLAIWQEDQAKIARQQAYMQELFRELPSTGRSYEFPNKDHLPGAQAYFEAYEELRAMLFHAAVIFTSC